MSHAVLGDAALAHVSCVRGEPRDAGVVGPCVLLAASNLRVFESVVWLL